VPAGAGVALRSTEPESGRNSGIDYTTRAGIEQSTTGSFLSMAVIGFSE